MGEPVRDTLAMVFWLDLLNLVIYGAGGIALISTLFESCGSTAFVLSNHIMAGSTHRCHETQALAVFLWFGITPSPP